MRLAAILILLSLFSHSQALKFTKKFSDQSFCWKGNGTTNYILIADNDTLDLGLNDFVISVWFMAESGVYAQHLSLFMKQNPELSNEWGFQVLTDGRIVFRANATNYAISSYGYNYLDSNWHRAVCTRFQDSIKIYIDGVSVTSNTECLENLTNSADMHIGYRNSAYNGYYKGKVRNIQLISGYGWNQDSVTVDFNSYNKNSAAFNLPLCEGYNDTAYDISGNNLNGLIIGSDYWSICNTQKHPVIYGFTKIIYNGNVCYLPYDIKKRSIYNDVKPVINSSEQIYERPVSYYGVSGLIKYNSNLLNK